MGYNIDEIEVVWVADRYCRSCVSELNWWFVLHVVVIGYLGWATVGIGESSKKQTYNLFSYSCCSDVFYSVIGRYCLLWLHWTLHFASTIGLCYTCLLIFYWVHHLCLQLQLYVYWIRWWVYNVAYNLDSLNTLWFRFLLEYDTSADEWSVKLQSIQSPL